MNDIDTLKNSALELMKINGYAIKEKVIVEVDERLPIMGYTTERNGMTLIVVSKWAVTSGGVTGLIIHEMSHVYRTESNHPSHNFSLHNRILNNVLMGRKMKSFQIEILRNTINNLQDLYADDISFSVYFRNEKKTISEFFLGWVHEPIIPARTSEDIWSNAGDLLNAAFAEANIKRHNAIDKDKKIERAVKDLLRKSDKKVASKYKYFKDVMVNMPEEISDKDFEVLLTKYINEFLELTDFTPHDRVAN